MNMMFVALFFIMIKPLTILNHLQLYIDNQNKKIFYSWRLRVGHNKRLVLQHLRLSEVKAKEIQIIPVISFSVCLNVTSGNFLTIC